MDRDSPLTRELLQVAQAAVFEIVSPSARSNVTDAVTAQAVEEYLRKEASGEAIDNPHAFVQVVARRRAIDAMRKWRRDKLRQDRIDVARDPLDTYASIASEAMLTLVNDGTVEYREVETRMWLDELIASVFPDEVNRQIAHRCLVIGEKPGDVADDVGLAAPAVSNRLARVRQKLQEELSVEDLLR